MSYRGCSFTGHRKIEYRHRDTIRPLLIRAVNYAYAEGCRDFYNGGAMGFDLLAADVVLEFRDTHPDIRLHMVIPCRNQAQGWSICDRDEYERILNAADSTECLSESYYNGCMHVRNRVLVERCDMLVAYLGSDHGGTASTVRLARSVGKTVYNLYPTLESASHS